MVVPFEFSYLVWGEASTSRQDSPCGCRVGEEESALHWQY